MTPHHEAWLAAHPERSEIWLHERLREGFDVHHVDGDHGNNSPSNLVLIETDDHFRLHGRPRGRPCADMLAVARAARRAARREETRGKMRLDVPIRAMTPAAFRDWRKSLGLSRLEAADALGLSVHTVATYETERRRDSGKPVVIPRVVALACAYLTHQRFGLPR